MKPIHALIAISLSTLTITTSIITTSFSLPFYQQKFAQYKVDELFAPGQAIQATQNIVDYTFSNETLDKNFFNPQEISHLADVKTFVSYLVSIQQWSLIIFLGSIIFTFARTKHRHHLPLVLLSAGVINLALMIIVVGVYITRGFDQLFLKFHQIFFVDNFSFDPNTSHLKALYPDAIFFDLVKTIIFTILVTSFIYIFLASIATKKCKANSIKKLK